MERSLIAPKKMPTAFIYTMGIPEELIETVNYKLKFSGMESVIERIFTKPHNILNYNGCLKNYSVDGR